MTVYFIGAGIGGIDYLTIKAHRIICDAEVIIYDALIDTEILDIASDDCLKICVGKRGGKVSTPQATINDLLVQYAKQYHSVIRLKSGDPAIFGRINSELDALQCIDTDIQFIPGISSALAVPLLAGIMLTEKDDSRCLTIVTAHNINLLNWSILSQIDTLVILMGGKNLSLIIQQLQLYGRSPNFPIAIIKNGGSPQQQTWKGTLSDIVEKTLNISLSPCIIVIGNVIKNEK
ncbi:MAG: uroporphyrinogen-III C-methyltransferase [Cyanobacteria bacterium]|nr:uroporphyrinogen-III C-methyltransferase [Cyanobacteria bacterium CG_2015-16_32_12]NCO79302.1 uroporphyrinogen-III C-methyltransferase [Cyanobacteria bacterium CG_2015-22_32_23]NCQ05050.1 uroporphyrinogen-III C-methyltransferase [Cyanobacteria bacterium CG_2015-09_32_10]NCQ41326.1 uroporphyrinogen-III C-methyltransferase [Cyanobacteria bacterium CG_2015-04_32_10]NCS84040.1 uroporphyrinogen-III C-methyltransferase [Cyanobacteria bacterium CG_2015-02_32_10]